MTMKKKHSWNFQLLPGQPDIVSGGYAMDTTGKAVEDEVQNVLPSYLHFHGVNKIVLQLGKSDYSEYIELDGVGIIPVSDFDLQKYAHYSEKKKIEVLHAVIAEAFDWLSTTFEDADTFRKIQKQLSWLS